MSEGIGDPPEGHLQPFCMAKVGATATETNFLRKGGATTCPLWENT